MIVQKTLQIFLMEKLLTLMNELKNLRQITKIETKTNSSTKISIKETYDDSSKNLANFFNGEIIDLDE